MLAALRNHEAATGRRSSTTTATCRCIRPGATAAKRCEDIIEAGIARGYAYLCGHRPFVRSADRPRRIDGTSSPRSIAKSIALNKEYRGRFRLLKGIEANIRADGGVDMDPGRTRPTRDRRGIAAFGSCASKADQTARMVRGGHDTGRSHPRPSARTDVRIASRRGRRMAASVRGGGSVGRRHRDRRRSVAAGYRLRSRAAADRLRLPVRARQRRALDARAEGYTETAIAQLDWPAFPPSGSSTAGRCGSCSSGPADDRQAPPGNHTVV